MLTYTFTADAPYGWSNEFQYTYKKLLDEQVTVEQGMLSVGDENLIVTKQNTDYFEIENCTDELNDFVYPLITISGNGGEKVSIENVSEISSDLLNHKVEITLPTNIDYSNALYIDSKNHKFYYTNNISKKKIPVTLSELGFSTESLTNMDNGSLGLYWPRLVPGNNKFIITGDCNVTMTFRCPRKVGAY